MKIKYKIQKSRLLKEGDTVEVVALTRCGYASLNRGSYYIGEVFIIANLQETSIDAVGQCWVGEKNRDFIAASCVKLIKGVQNS